MGNDTNSSVPQSITNAQGELYLYGGAYDPTVILTPALRGSLFIRVAKTNSGIIALYRKLDNQPTLNWELLEGLDGIEIKKDGVLLGEAEILDFVGANIILTQVGPKEYTIEVNSAVAVSDEGVVVNPDTSNFNFVGTGVTASDAGGGQSDISIPGNLVSKNGIYVLEPTVIYNFKGVGVLVTQNGSTQVDIEIPGINGGNISPFNDKFLQFGAIDVRVAQGAAGSEVQGISVVSLGQAGTSELTRNVRLSNYQAGDFLNIEMAFFPDTITNPANRGVVAVFTIKVWQIGTDVSTIIPVVINDTFDVPNAAWQAFRRLYTLTPAQLGSLPDGDYYVNLEWIRQGNAGGDTYNKNIYFFMGKADWKQ